MHVHYIILKHNLSSRKCTCSEACQFKVQVDEGDFLAQNMGTELEKKITITIRLRQQSCDGVPVVRKWVM